MMTPFLKTFIYVFTLIVIATLSVVFWNLSKKKGKDWTHKIILILVWSNFAIHYLKQLVPFYLVDFPFSLKRSTAENLCALLVTVSPFIYTFGGKYSKDYMCVIGFLSGLLACLSSSTVSDITVLTGSAVFEWIRYYFCHSIFIYVAIMMYASGLHQISYKRVWGYYFSFMAAQTIIFLNEYLCWKSGLHPITELDFWSRNVGNGSLVFGPYSSLDPILGWLYNLIPSVFKFTTGTGDLGFIPVAWMLIPCLFIVPLLFVLLIILDYKNFIYDFDEFKSKLKAKHS